MGIEDYFPHMYCKERSPLIIEIRDFYNNKLNINAPHLTIADRNGITVVDTGLLNLDDCEREKRRINNLVNELRSRGYSIAKVDISILDS